VIEAVMRAVRRIPPGTPESLGSRFTPRDLASREDVEHWGRRLDLAGAPRGSRCTALRALFAAALHRLNDIGPRRLSPAAS
jgi:hypothetical protein